MWERLGTAGLVVVVLCAVITWLLRERARLLGELAASYGRERELAAELLDQSQKLIPISEHLATVTQAASEALLRDHWQQGGT